MQITHEEARRLLQFSADSRLNSPNEENLATHLTSCIECRTYAVSLRETESILRQSLRKHLALRPLPLQMDAVYGKVIQRRGSSILLATRKVILGVAFVMFAFITWRSMGTNNGSFPQLPSGTVPVIPTPSTFTATNTQQDACRELTYVVQEGDTLDGIARRFSVSEESIRLTNHLTDDTLLPSRELILTLCESTPAGTLNAPTFTITPATQIVITTPG